VANTSCVLVGESFSPFTQRARWALEYAGVPHAYEEYVPTLSEPGMRLRLRQWTGQVSVPLLLAGDDVIRGSWDIARYGAERAGDGRLGDLAQCEPWHQLSDDAICEARTRVVRGVLANPQALDEAAAGVFPAGVAKYLRFVARDAAQRLDRKYAHLAQPGALRRALLATRAGLASAGGEHLLGRFSYADIAMVVVLEAVAPSARTEPPLGPHTRACWSDTALASEFADLLAWRARLLRTSTPVFSQLAHLIQPDA
jgi:glutathione S-transferase